MPAKLVVRYWPVGHRPFRIMGSSRFSSRISQHPRGLGILGWRSFAAGQLPPASGYPWQRLFCSAFPSLPGTLVAARNLHPAPASRLRLRPTDCAYQTLSTSTCDLPMSKPGTPIAIILFPPRKKLGPASGSVSNPFRFAPFPAPLSCSPSLAPYSPPRLRFPALPFTPQLFAPLFGKQARCHNDR